MFFNSRITAIGPEVAELAKDGLLILFADGAPPELAEVSVMHKLATPVSRKAPLAGAKVKVGHIEAKITAMGPMAWDKAIDMGHIVFNFGGASTVDRPGEICVSPVETSKLLANLVAGHEISIA